jgi:hypothetical protein
LFNTLKKIGSITSLIILAGSAFAGGMETNNTAATKGAMQFGVTGMYDEMVDDFGIGFAAQNAMWEFGVNGSVDANKKANGTSYTEYYVGAYAGWRHALKSDFYGSLGVMGNYGFYSGDHVAGGKTYHPYTVGAYVGMAYQPKDHVQIFVRLMPYSYESNDANLKENEFFQEGQVGISYFF